MGDFRLGGVRGREAVVEWCPIPPADFDIADHPSGSP
jgi:hypothetical protein